MILGGNLIGGWAHARDLIYVSKLFKAYNTEEKIFQTLRLAEQYGINTILIDVTQMDIVNKYKKQNAGKIQMIVYVKPPEENPIANIDVAADKGASTIYLHGAAGDTFVKKGRVDIISKTLEHIQKERITGGRRLSLGLCPAAVQGGKNRARLLGKDLPPR